MGRPSRAGEEKGPEGCPVAGLWVERDQVRDGSPKLPPKFRVRFSQVSIPLEQGESQRLCPRYGPLLLVAWDRSPASLCLSFPTHRVRGGLDLTRKLQDLLQP